MDDVGLFIVLQHRGCAGQANLKIPHGDFAAMSRDEINKMYVEPSFLAARQALDGEVRKLS